MVSKTLPKAMPNINNDSVVPNGKATRANPRELVAIRQKNKAKQAAIDLFIFNLLLLVYKQGTVNYSPFTKSSGGNLLVPYKPVEG